jgi:hypothetical protein
MQKIKLPLFSEGTKYFNYYPNIPSKKYVETKTDCCTIIENVSSNNHEMSNPINVRVNRFDGWDGYILESDKGDELWQILNKKEVKLYKLLHHDRIIQPLGIAVVNKIINQKEIQENCIVIPVSRKWCPIGEFDCNKYEINFWIEEIIQIGKTLSYMAKNGISISPYDIYNNCYFLDEKLKITSLYGCSKSITTEAEHNGATALCLLLFYVLSHYCPDVELGPELLTQINIDLNFDSDSKVLSSFDEVMSSLEKCVH